MGAVALVLMLTAEFTLVLWLRGRSIRDYVAGRDLIAAIVYYASLLLFVLMPFLMRRAGAVDSAG